MKQFQFPAFLIFALILILSLNDGAVSPKVGNPKSSLTLYKFYWKSLFLQFSCNVAKYICGLDDKPGVAMTTTTTTPPPRPTPVHEVTMTSTTTVATTTEVTTTTEPPPPQPMYIIVEEKLNWMEAHINCKLHGYDLTTVEDESEFVNLQGVIGDSNVTTVRFLWTGGNDLFREGKFTWVSTGQEFTEFFPRGNVEPTRLPMEDCVFLYYSPTFNMFVMADYPCDFKAESICKKFDMN